ARLQPLMAALHLCLEAVLARAPDDARVVCVGAGTGAELLRLAAARPGWRFTAVDPAPAMLARCRQRAEAAGVAARCRFHVGTLDTLPPGEPFDVATAILVSHFLVDTTVRREFFTEIARRLRPGGLLASCDLATELATPTFDRLYEAWETALTRAEFPVSRAAFGTGIGMLSPRELERLIASSGFDAPTPFFQAFFMHAWVSRRSSVDER
ncbi:MAG: class I SAM-dependent methyltransferase, partial [Myxococcales bacterium]|nr:class I SAM-dependent methyltransferase [Myxococcales bacterium]